MGEGEEVFHQSFQGIIRLIESRDRSSIFGEQMNGCLDENQTTSNLPTKTLHAQELLPSLFLKFQFEQGVRIHRCQIADVSATTNPGP